MDHEDKNSEKEGKTLAGVSTRTLRAADEASDGVSGHSPLPWRADTFAIYDGNNVPAAHTGACGRSNKQRIANAHLIVNAVNSQAQLVAEIEGLKQHIRDLDHDCQSANEHCDKYHVDGRSL